MMKRLRPPFVGCVSVTWSVVMVSASVSSMRSPRASENAAVRQAVLHVAVDRQDGRSSVVNVIGLP